MENIDNYESVVFYYQKQIYRINGDLFHNKTMWDKLYELKEKVKPFLPEIVKEGGYVAVDIEHGETDKDIKFKYNTVGLSDELAQKVLEIL